MESLQIVGTGSLGEAIARGLLEAEYVDPSELTLVHRSPERARSVVADHPGVNLSTSPISGVDAIVCVKPEEVTSIVADMRHVGLGRVVSVAAGVPLATLQDAAGRKDRVFRAMPNIAVKYRLGQTAVACDPTTERDDVEWARALFDQLGDARVIDESIFDAFTTIYGCAPGFLMKFISAMTDAAVDQGFDRQDARRLLISSLRGNARWLNDNAENMDEELHLMTRLGGPTSALVAHLDENGFDEVLIAAAAAATARSREMNGGG